MAVLTLGLNAQDARQRTVETVVADVLAAMPAANSADFETQMADLAAAAPESIVQVAAMLKPTGAGVENSIFEYALSGVSRYASAADKSVKAKVGQGFKKAVEATADPANKAFLLDQFRRLATAEDAEFLGDMAENPDLASIAVGALANMEGSEDVILGLMNGGKTSKSLLADAAARKGMTSTESILKGWLFEADKDEASSIFSALSVIGSESSLDLLKYNSYPDYAALASSLAGRSNGKAVAKAAKNLLESDVSAYRSAGALAQMKNDPEKALKTLKTALKSEDGQFRVSVLDNATELLGAEELVPLLEKVYPKASDGAKSELLTWFGDNKVESAAELVLGSMAAGGDVSKNAVEAAGKIGGDASAAALVALLGGELDAEASKALKSFDGDLSGLVLEALEGTSDAKVTESLLSLAADKKMKSVAGKAYSLLDSPETAASAKSALKNLVGVGDIQRLGALVDAASSEDLPYYQAALVSAVGSLEAKEQYSNISGLMKTAKNAAAFYPVLASTGTEEAVADLSKAFGEGDKSAFASLLKVDNYAAAPALLDIAKSNKDLSENALGRFINLVSSYETDNGKKLASYAEALDLSDAKSVKTSALKALSAVPTMKAFLQSGNYLEDSDKDVALAASDAVRRIAAVTDEPINYADMKASFEKASKNYAARGLQDDGYAIDEMNTILARHTPVEPYKLTPEEESQGFEVLFDGSSLDNWQGDKKGYIPVNGEIIVTANYGSDGNLYTKKEYRNFVFRFEFCFLRPGVNNGVGIRTPMGVDAAYDAMAEIQILDHDAPIYANLREYQVHGSAYGVIPAKRIVHKPLGEWSTEEIRVEGDHITVTVNGEVILDGNLRKACKGHNIAPDGTSVNKYTVDKRNHPGMFNERGFISFCGHGEGLKLRNIRVLDLGD